MHFTFSTSCVASNRYAFHVFKLLTLLVLVVQVISLSSYVVSSCWLLLHSPHLFKFMKLLVVVVCFLAFFLKLSVVAMHLTSLSLPLGFLVSTLKELHFFLNIVYRGKRARGEIFYVGGKLGRRWDLFSPASSWTCVC